MKKTKKIYHTKNDSINKAYIVQSKNNRYAALKPTNKFAIIQNVKIFFT